MTQTCRGCGSEISEVLVERGTVRKCHAEGCGEIWLYPAAGGEPVQEHVVAGPDAETRRQVLVVAQATFEEVGAAYRRLSRGIEGAAEHSRAIAVALAPLRYQRAVRRFWWSLASLVVFFGLLGWAVFQPSAAESPRWAWSLLVGGAIAGARIVWRRAVLPLRPKEAPDAGRVS